MSALRYADGSSALLTPNIGRRFPQEHDFAPWTVRCDGDPGQRPGLTMGPSGLELNAAARQAMKKPKRDQYDKHDQAGEVYTLEFVAAPGGTTAHNWQLLARQPGGNLGLTDGLGNKRFVRLTMGHSSLMPEAQGPEDPSQCDAVLFAGTLRFNPDGTLAAWTNNSGHYAPHPALARAVADERLPLNKFVPHHVLDAFHAKEAGNARRKTMQIDNALRSVVRRLYVRGRDQGRNAFNALVNHAHVELSASFPGISKNTVRKLLPAIVNETKATV